MRKKIIKKPNPIGYAMLEKHGESNYVCLYDETAFDVVFEHAQEYIQNHSTQDYLDYDWQIVAYSNEEAWKEDGLYDSIVLRIKGNTIKQYDVVTEYLTRFIHVSMMVYFYQHWNHRLRRSVKSIAQHQHGIRSWKSIH